MRFQRRSDKHGPREDDALKHDTELIERDGGEQRAEEWEEEQEQEQRPPGEFRPDRDLAPEGELVGGVPPGVDVRDVIGRSELARWLQPSVFPATAGELLGSATETDAPGDVWGLLETLPQDRVYQNVQDVWRTLGGGVEDPAYRA
jgi:hypothetical protein